MAAIIRSSFLIAPLRKTQSTPGRPAPGAGAGTARRCSEFRPARHLRRRHLPGGRRPVIGRLAGCLRLTLSSLPPPRSRGYLSLPEAPNRPPLRAPGTASHRSVSLELRAPRSATVTFSTTSSSPGWRLATRSIPCSRITASRGSRLQVTALPPTSRASRSDGRCPRSGGSISRDGPRNWRAWTGGQPTRRSDRKSVV